MPDYSKLHELVSHRVTIEYDTGARIIGYLAACLPGSGQVQFAKLTSVELIGADGQVADELDELTICPNVLTGFHLDEGPRGRDL
ncbi:MAG: hypothetical protein MJE77_45770 [Proteobacteria bacterium]|nr:hypothetical protein [Pseudomonadota bacterium]